MTHEGDREKLLRNIGLTYRVKRIVFNREDDHLIPGEVATILYQYRLARKPDGLEPEWGFLLTSNSDAVRDTPSGQTMPLRATGPFIGILDDSSGGVETRYGFLPESFVANDNNCYVVTRDYYLGLNGQAFVQTEITLFDEDVDENYETERLPLDIKEEVMNMSWVEEDYLAVEEILAKIENGVIIPKSRSFDRPGETKVIADEEF